VADEDGKYSYVQDLAKPHHVFIVEKPGTKYIRDEPNGGDCGLIGTWDGAAKTCTLTMDVAEMIVLDSDGVTLNGGGWSVSGSSSYGIYASGRTGIAVADVHIRGPTYGIYLYFSDLASVSGSTVSEGGSYGYAWGIILVSSDGSTLSGNAIWNGGRFGDGISLDSSRSSTISGNTVLVDNSSMGVRIFRSTDVLLSANTLTGGGVVIDGTSISEWDTHTIGPTNMVNGKPVHYCKNTSGGTIPGGAGQVILVNCSNMIVENQHISDVYTGIAVAYGSGNTIRSNMVSGGFGVAIRLVSASSSTVTGNTLPGVAVGVLLSSSGSSTVSGNMVSGYHGIFVESSPGSTISGNLLSSLVFGVYLDASSGGLISGNTISSRNYGIYTRSSGGGIISGNTITGGRTAGVYLFLSEGVTVYCNAIRAGSFGIYLWGSNGNRLYGNNLISGINSVTEYSSTNIWNSVANEGNFWKDYAGLDNGAGGRSAGDGIGDTNLPHYGVDWYPMMRPTGCAHNFPPEIRAFTALSQPEGVAVSYQTSASDPEGVALVYSFDLEGDGIFDVVGTSDTASHLFIDDFTGTARLQVSDGTYAVEQTALVVVTNVAPTVVVSSPPSGSLYSVGQPVTFAGAFTDAGVADTHTAEWTFDTLALPGSVLEAGGTGTVMGTYVFTVPGIYLVTLTVTDDDDGVGTTSYTTEGLPAFIVVYDPNGGFFTGGGWIDSPIGGYLYDPSLTGRATFGFQAKYQKGQSQPSGDTEFRFIAGDLLFQSSSYHWLVVANSKAMFKGSGTLTVGHGRNQWQMDVGFLISAVDGDYRGGQDVDRFRIKVWNRYYEWEIVYDNMRDWSDEANPPGIGGGRITIQKG